MGAGSSGCWEALFCCFGGASMAQRRWYATDLTDKEWALIAPLLPPAKPGGRPRSTDLREVLNALSSWLRSGGAVELPPPHLPPVEGHLLVRRNCPTGNPH